MILKSSPATCCKGVDAYIKKTGGPSYNKYKEKFIILQSIGIIEIKSKETRVVAYTHRYSSGPLISNSAIAKD